MTSGLLDENAKEELRQLLLEKCWRVQQFLPPVRTGTLVLNVQHIDKLKKFVNDAETLSSGLHLKKLESARFKDCDDLTRRQYSFELLNRVCLEIEEFYDTWETTQRCILEMQPWNLEGWWDGLSHELQGLWPLVDQIHAAVNAQLNAPLEDTSDHSSPAAVLPRITRWLRRKRIKYTSLKKTPPGDCTTASSTPLSNTAARSSFCSSSPSCLPAEGLAAYVKDSARLRERQFADTRPPPLSPSTIVHSLTSPFHSVASSGSDLHPRGTGSGSAGFGSPTMPPPQRPLPLLPTCHAPVPINPVHSPPHIRREAGKSDSRYRGPGLFATGSFGTDGCASDSPWTTQSMKSAIPVGNSGVSVLTSRGTNNASRAPSSVTPSTLGFPRPMSSASSQHNPYTGAHDSLGIRGRGLPKGPVCVSSLAPCPPKYSPDSSSGFPPSLLPPPQRPLPPTPTSPWPLRKDSLSAPVYINPDSDTPPFDYLDPPVVATWAETQQTAFRLIPPGSPALSLNTSYSGTRGAPTTLDRGKPTMRNLSPTYSLFPSIPPSVPTSPRSPSSQTLTGSSSVGPRKLGHKRGTTN